MLDVYKNILEKLLAIPVLQGEKTESEKFAGAVNTYTVETMMHDGKALQAGTSHYFGQNFSRPFAIKFNTRDKKEDFAYQTSWGISTRLIGAIIMAHGDNRGLKLPPRVAPIQAVIVPISLNDEVVAEKSRALFQLLNKKFRVHIDDRDNYTPGYKFNDWEMRGVPVRIEIGPRDVAKNQCVIICRDTKEKVAVDLNNIGSELESILEKIQDRMLSNCQENQNNRTTSAKTLVEFVQKINDKQGYIKAMWCGSEECEEKIKNETGAKSRCIPFVQEEISDTCVVCGKNAKHLVFWGRQY